MIVAHQPLKDLLGDRLGPVAKRTKGAGKILVDLMDGQAEMDRADEGQPDCKEQEVVVERTKVQMAKAVAPDELEELADEPAIRAVDGLDEKIGLGPALFRRRFTGKVMIGQLFEKNGHLIKLQFTQIQQRREVFVMRGFIKDDPFFFSGGSRGSYP